MKKKITTIPNSMINYSIESNSHNPYNTKTVNSNNTNPCEESLTKVSVNYFVKEFYSFLPERAVYNAKFHLKEDKKSEQSKVLENYDFLYSDFNTIQQFCGMELPLTTKENVCVIDIDDVSYMEKIPGLTKTLTVSTPSGGYHFWYKFPNQLHLPGLYSVFSDSISELGIYSHFDKMDLVKTVDLLSPSVKNTPQLVGIPPSKGYSFILKKQVQTISDELLNFWWEKYKEVLALGKI